MSPQLMSTYICDKCRAQRQWYRQAPSMPDGWVMLGERLYCDKHAIKLIIDGEEIEHKQVPIAMAPPAWETDT